MTDVDVLVTESERTSGNWFSQLKNVESYVPPAGNANKNPGVLRVSRIWAFDTSGDQSEECSVRGL